MDEIVKNIGFMYLELEDQVGNFLKIDYNEELVNDLVENDGWIEIEKETNDHRSQHYIFPNQKQVIRSINWVE